MNSERNVLESEVDMTYIKIFFGNILIVIGIVIAFLGIGIALHWKNLTAHEIEYFLGVLVMLYGINVFFGGLKYFDK